MKKGISGADIPIHIRYAIDNKPSQYTTIPLEEDTVTKLKTQYPTLAKNLTVCNSKTYTTENYDWREIIYQMAKDYRKLHYIDDYNIWLSKYNPMYISNRKENKIL